MTSDTIIITCAYHSSYTSLPGGRGWPVNYYYSSIRNTLELGLPVILFTSGHDAQAIKDHFAEFKDRLEVRVRELKDLRHYDFFMNQKEAYMTKNKFQCTYGSNVRCEIICFNKIFFLRECLANVFGATNYIWMDAGITHESLFPTAVGGIRINKLESDNFYAPINPDNIFNRVLGQCLCGIIKQHHLFYIGSIRASGMPSALSRRLSEISKQVLNSSSGSSPTMYITGGLFGLNITEAISLIDRFELMLVELMKSSEFLYTEEPILTIINHEFPVGKVFTFDTWYHDCADCPGYIKTSPSMKNYYRIYTEDIKTYAQ